MLSHDIAIISSKSLSKSGGILSVTQTLFTSIFPIYYLDEETNLETQLSDVRTVVFSGFDQTFVKLARHLKGSGKKVVVFWHFSSASEVDPDIGNAWRSLLPLFAEHLIDLFVTCKKGFDVVVSKLFNVPTFFILNNSFDSSFAGLPKRGLGIYSGSSDYWIKNLRPNLYAALMTGLPVDILPYDSTLQNIVEGLQKTDFVTGISKRVNHDTFMMRLASRELISYVTFSECGPIIPLEALNNGVICLTGNNHHYFEEDSRLKSFLIVNRPDDPTAIYQSIMTALENKREILGRYKIWKFQYDEKQKANFEQFINLITSL